MPIPPKGCRTCGSLDVSDLGSLPDVAIFAGAQLDRPLEGGSLRLCHGCRFVFRAPILTDEEYLSLYAHGSAEVWEPREPREDFRLVLSQIPDAPIDVLDVGCYTGHLLAELPKSCRLYGVEPNPAAAAVAVTRGVNIVAKDWNGLDAAGHDYDIIIACDVIEHVSNPLAFLTSLAKRLKPGGKVIITTGNADAWIWTLLRSRFWYCYFPEHISFIGSRWLSRMTAPASMRIEFLESFSHSQLPSRATRAKAMVMTTLQILVHSGRLSWLESVMRKRVEYAFPLGGGLSKDHILCVLSRS